MCDKIVASNFECIPLQWDTDYFGVKSARVNLTGGVIDKEHQNRIIEFSKNFNFITISNLNNIKENNQWLGSRTNAFMADMNVQFLKVLEDKMDYQDESTYVVNNFTRNENIIKIARDAFQYSRFFNDPNLPQKLAKNIYLHWTECAFSQDNKYFTVFDRVGQIAGYILFSLNMKEESSVIELIAVDEKYQGQRVGRTLINAMEAFVREKGIKKIKVGTQVDNISAVQFYSAVGFKYASCGSVYHLWV